MEILNISDDYIIVNKDTHIINGANDHNIFILTFLHLSIPGGIFLLSLIDLIK